MIRLAVILIAATLAAAVSPANAGASDTQPLLVRTSIAPAWIYVGDAVTARVDVYFDPRRIAPGSVRVTSPFGLWRELEEVRTSSADSSTLDRRTWAFTLECSAQSCLPSPRVIQAFALPRLTITATGSDGSVIAVHAAWPKINVGGRIAAPNVHAIVSLKAENGVPSATYRVSPQLLALLLSIVGSLLVAAGIVGASLEIARRLRAKRAPLDAKLPLVRSLELVRQAQERDSGDQRLAVGLLARVIPRDSEALSSAAAELAWSANKPSAETLDEIARRVEAELEPST